MNSGNSTRAAKGQLKCFHCRLLVRSKDGDWKESSNQQIFVCHTCERTPEARATTSAMTLVSLKRPAR